MGLGDIDRIGLAEARKKAAEASSLIVDGKDPINERKARKAALAIEKAKALSFKECADQYITMQEPGWKNPKSPNQWRASLKSLRLSDDRQSRGSGDRQSADPENT